MVESNKVAFQVVAGRTAASLMISTQQFFRLEASGGILLALFAMLAVIIANTPLFVYYDYILNSVKFTIGFSDINDHFNLDVKKSLLLWINDGFMAIFFLLVGLEIKREFVEGELSSRSKALLPAMGAFGGMVIPAVLYYLINMDHPDNLSGWAIPAATDIAFALGVLSLLGTRVPIQLKVLLTAIAVIDDLGAILIIAFFYTGDIKVEPLYFGLAALVAMTFLNRSGVSKISPYILLGTILWVAVLKSGIHATLAGVITAMFVPMSSGSDKYYSPCKTLEHGLHPWVAFGILPLFALANAGVPFSGMGLHSFAEPITLGIIAGLVIGKQMGIFSMLVLAIKTGLSPMPQNSTWIQLYGVSILCGIGFTMSLFIGELAFEGIAQQAEIRLGVLVGSIISAIIGFSLLYFVSPKSADKAEA